MTGVQTCALPISRVIARAVEMLLKAWLQVRTMNTVSVIVELKRAIGAVRSARFTDNEKVGSSNLLLPIILFLIGILERVK